MQTKTMTQKFNLSVAIALSATFLILLPGKVQAEYYYVDSDCEVVEPVAYYYSGCSYAAPCYEVVEIVAKSPRRVGPKMGAGELVEYIWIDP